MARMEIRWAGRRAVDILNSGWASSGVHAPYTGFKLSYYKILFRIVL